MPRHLRTVVGLLLSATALQLGLGTTSVAADAPTHGVIVSGDGVSTYPGFDPDVDRYAVRTGDDTDGRVTVTASTTDPEGVVTVDGRPVTSGSPLELTGLDVGDEVSVAIQDSSGTSHQSFIYLPAGFPELAATGARPAGSAPYVFLGLGSFLTTASFETVVDDRGVPIYVHSGVKAHDFKVSAADPSHYTIARQVPASTNDDAGFRIDELGPDFGVLDSFTLAPTGGIIADDTDFHDVEMTPDGHVVLVGYSRDQRDGTTWLDAVIQIQDRAGHALFTWDSKDHVDPSEAYVLGPRHYDYAHINSVQLLPNGDLLASFRNLGQVMRIATTARPGLAPGDVVWRMGGKRSEFTFPGDPEGGFCAQHDARLLANGHLLLFDNGSAYETDSPIHDQTADMCPGPEGTRVARPQTRVVEYNLNEAARTATQTWTYQVNGRYAAFAGNVQRLGDPTTGDTLIGWSAATQPEGAAPITSEVSAAGDELWSLTAQGWFSYRAFTYDAPDAIAPEIEIAIDHDAPSPPGTLVVDYTCTDRGGSNLRSCEGPVPSGTAWTVDPEGFTVTATDGAGNGTASGVGVSTPARAPSVDIRRPGGSWRGHHVRFSLRHAGDAATAVVRIRNREAKQALPVRGRPGDRAFTVRYFHGGDDITRRVSSGRMTTPVLHRDETWTMRVKMRRTSRADRGDHLDVPVRATDDVGLTGRVEARLRTR